MVHLVILERVKYCGENAKVQSSISVENSVSQSEWWIRLNTEDFDRKWSLKGEPCLEKLQSTSEAPLWIGSPFSCRGKVDVLPMESAIRLDLHIK